MTASGVFKFWPYFEGRVINDILMLQMIHNNMYDPQPIHMHAMILSNVLEISTANYWALPVKFSGLTTLVH